MGQLFFFSLVLLAFSGADGFKSEFPVRVVVDGSSHCNYIMLSHKKWVNLEEIQ